MPVRNFEQIEPIMHECACSSLGLHEPVKLDKALIAGDGSGYITNVGAYRQFCDKVEACFHQKSGNVFVLSDHWRNGNAGGSLGDFIAAASMEAVRQQRSPGV